MANVGFIGLGIMGTPMAGHLLAAGHRVHAWSRSKSAAELSALGCSPCDSARTLAQRSEVIITMVSDTPDVEAVLFGPGGVAEGLSPGKLIIDMSSISPVATQDFAARVARQGCDYVDAPVSGGDVGAKAATLTIMVGASETAFARARPFLEKLGKSVTLIGGVGAGQTCKLANQIVVALNVEAVAEALLFASRAGVDPARVRQALLGGYAGSRVMEIHGERMIARQFAPGFRIELHLKDMRNVLATAASLGISLPHTASCAEFLRQAGAAGDAQLDNSALLRQLERAPGNTVT